MISETCESTKGGNLKKPGIDLVAQWLKIAWDTIPTEMIKKSFQMCCISNALDGAEDDIIFDSDNELGAG